MVDGWENQSTEGRLQIVASVTGVSLIQSCLSGRCWSYPPFGALSPHKRPCQQHSQRIIASVVLLRRPDGDHKVRRRLRFAGVRNIVVVACDAEAHFSGL